MQKKNAYPDVDIQGLKGFIHVLMEDEELLEIGINYRIHPVLLCHS